MASFRGPQRFPERIQTPGPSQHNMSLGPERKFQGGGGMAVGPLRTAQGHPKHPKAARTALVSAMKG